MKFNVSEWGFTQKFETLEEAINYCHQVNGLTSGEEGLLWISGENRKELELLIQKGILDFDYMRVKHIDAANNWIWDSIDGVWEDASDTERHGEEDYKQKYEIRKQYIDNKFIGTIEDKIAQFGDGPLEFETKDIERLCKIARMNLNLNV